MGTEKIRRIRKVSWLLFIIYMIALSYFLFFSERYGRTSLTEDYPCNFTLFREIRRYFTYIDKFGFEYFMVNMLGNVIALIPFGACYPVLHKRKVGAVRTVAATFLLSLTIELIQLVFKVGIFDVDDMFMNTMGGLLGYLAYAFVRRLILKGRTDS